jgi:hypothetical protein
MTGLLTQSAPFRTISIKELHPSYGAEIIGADFQNMSDEQFRETKAAMAKVFVASLIEHFYSHLFPSMAFSFSATRACQMLNMSTSLRASASSTTCEDILPAGVS